MKIRLLFMCVALGLIAAGTSTSFVHAQGLAGRLITFKKTFDGWWDVACDTAPDGTDARCYVQYVDPYSLPPNLRAAMVDFLYRKSSNGKAEPVISFDIEPDLSFARDVEMTIVSEDSSTKVISMQGCTTGNCIFTGTTARFCWFDGQAPSCCGYGLRSIRARPSCANGRSGTCGK